MLTARTAILLHAAERGERAKRFAETALREALPPLQQAEVLLSISEMFAISPEVRADSGRRALALPGLPPALHSRLQAQLLYNLVVAGRAGEAHAVLADVTRAVETEGDRTAHLIQLLSTSVLEYLDGRFGPARRIVEAAMHACVETGEGSRLRLAQHFHCGILAATGNMAEALQRAADGVATAQRERHGLALHMFETWRGRQYFQCGRLADAAAALEGRYVLDGPDTAVTSLDAASVLTLGRVAIHTGDGALGRRIHQLALTMLAQDIPEVRRHAAWLLALQALADGDARLARERLCAFGPAVRLSLLPMFPLDPTDETHLVRIALASGDRELAEHAVTAAARRAENNPDVRDMAATAAHTSGLVSGNARELAEAAALFENGPRRLALASVLEDLGRVRIRSGEHRGGVEAMDRALAFYVEAGASWDAGRVRRGLREQGVRRRLVLAERPDRGWAAVTESELAVVRLIAAGRTNREAAEHLFISPHTVSSHLRHVFTKLEINSRVELARLAAEIDREPVGRE